MQAGEGLPPELGGRGEESLRQEPFLRRTHPAEAFPLGGVERFDRPKLHVSKR